MKKEKMFQQENQMASRRSFSLRSILLIMLVVGFGVGLTVYTLGTTFAAVTGVASNTSLQSTSATTTTTTHNCTRTSTN